jgi:heme-degrading monooxygenase HmoA
VALGRFRESLTGDIEPRQVLILVEWSSREAFDSYRADPALADLHPHRERGTSGYVWQLFDRLSDLRPLLKDE